MNDVVKMRNIRYINVSIPEGLSEGIDEFIKNNPKLDLRFRAQVVSLALRILLIENKRKVHNKKNAT